MTPERAVGRRKQPPGRGSGACGAALQPLPSAWNEALLAIAAADKSDFPAALRRILQTDAETLGVERVGFWSLRCEPTTAIECEGTWHTSRRALESGERLGVRDYPLYFRALLGEPIVVADDAACDGRTSAFRDSYLVPHGIASMMDVPVWVDGALAGVLCHEHVGPPRTWTYEEKVFACSVARLLARAVDRRDRARADEAAASSERELQLLRHGLRDHAVFLLAPNGTIATWNEGARAMFGWTEGEIVGRPASALYPADDLGRAEAARDLAAGSSGGAEREGWRVRKDGAQLWAETTLTPLRDERGAPLGIALVARDVTARKRHALLADASLALLSSLDLCATLDATAQLAVPFLADWCVIDLVDAYGCLCHASFAHADPERRAELIRWTHAYATGNRTPPIVLQAVRSARVVTARHLESEWPSRICDPSHEEMLRHVGISSIAVAPLKRRDGVVIGALTVARATPSRGYDPTDLAALESLAERLALAVTNATAYEASRPALELRDEFLAVASHELRTPLTPLRLALESCFHRPREGEELAAPLASRLRLALRQVDRLQGLVDALTAVTELSSGNVSLALARVRPAEIVQRVVDEMRDEARAKGCEIRLRTSAVREASWDDARIASIVRRLIGNALKYGAGAPVEVSVDELAGWARITVRDHGIGLPPSRSSGIFERFSRGVSSRSYGGLGLGLYIAREVARTHGGRIWAENAPDGGALFTVELPLAVAGPPAASSAG